MVYDIPADPEWDLQALLAKVSDLCKEAVAGGIFLGDIGDLADQHDVTSAVAELQNQRFSALRSLSRTLGATQEDRRADYGANVCTVMSGNMQLAALDTDTYTKEASCIPSNLKIYEIILPNTIY